MTGHPDLMTSYEAENLEIFQIREFSRFFRPKYVKHMETLLKSCEDVPQRNQNPKPSSFGFKTKERKK